MRVKKSVASHQKHQKIRRSTKGMTHSRQRSIRMGRQGLIRAMQYTYRDRRNRKRAFRALWNSRINAAARQQGLSYNQLIYKLKKANININRKILAELAVHEPAAFQVIVENVK